MKTSNFFIKSNYINNAKDRWIFCEGRLFYHQNITFLHLKSQNHGRNVTEIISDSESNCSGFSTLSKMQKSRSRSKKHETRLNVLCNLVEFKSCEIKSVNFETVNKFAIKLVPSGFLSSKKLYLLPDLEDSLTEWCGLLTGFITKTLNFSIVDCTNDDRNSLSISSTLRSSTIIERTHIPATTKDVYISLDDNDAYEATNQNEFYLAKIEPSEDSVKLNLQGSYLLKLGVESLELLSATTREAIHTFPYSSIRRFGAKDTMFRLEAGRHCSTGNGSFTFQIKDAAHVSDKLKENAKLFKNRNSTHNSCMTLNRPSRSDVSLQVETKRNSSLSSKGNNVFGTLPLNHNNNNTNSGCITPKNEVEDFQDKGSTNTIMIETSSDKNAHDDMENERIDSCKNDKNENSKNDSLDSEKKDKNTKEPVSFVEEVIGDKTFPIEKNIDRKDNITKIKNMTLPMKRHDENIHSGSNFINYKSDNVINKEKDENITGLRPMNLFESSSYGGSLHGSVSFNTHRNCTPPIISGFKVSDSTFFKYRQLPKPPIQMLPPLPDSTHNSLRRPQKIDSIPMDIESPKNSPPPLLPKPKFQIPEENFNQNDYREFDKMLENLQLSLR